MDKIYNKTNVLFLDDERNPSDVRWVDHEIYQENNNIVWHIVRNYDDFIGFLKDNQMPEHVSFDHDLGLEKSGMDCAHFLVEFCMDHHLDLPSYTVHSLNSVGKENIEGLLVSFKTHQHQERQKHQSKPK